MANKKKTLPEYIKDVIQQHGCDVVKNIQLVNILCDIMSFDDIPAAKSVLRTVLKAGYGQELLNINEGYWKIKVNALSAEICQNYGYQQDLVDYLLNSIGYGLGKSKIIPKYKLLTVPSNGDDLSKETQEEKLKEKLKKKYKDDVYKSFIQYHYSLLESADKGDPIDQYHVGEWFSKKRIDKIAVSWYLAAAKQGHTPAQTKLALCYEEGRGIPQSKNAAIKWYKEAASKGDETAIRRYLKLKYNNRTYESVIRYRLQLLYDADNNDKNSQYLLGEWFSNHNTQSAYREEAVFWFTKAAKNGHKFAMLKLGECYENGTGVNSNYSEAFKWYKKAAKNGNESACQKLAESYLYGRMVNKDVAEAVKWYGLAGGGICGADLCNIGYAYDVGDAIQMDKSKAVDYYRRAAQKNNSTAQYNLGVCYENGTGVEKNLYEAKRWYEKAITNGKTEARSSLERVQSEIILKKNRKIFWSFVYHLIMGSIYGIIGYYAIFKDEHFSQMISKIGIHVPETWYQVYPTNLVICLTIGFIISLLFGKYDD